MRLAHSLRRQWDLTPFSLGISQTHQLTYRPGWWRRKAMMDGGGAWRIDGWQSWLTWGRVVGCSGIHCELVAVVESADMRLVSQGEGIVFFGWMVWRREVRWHGSRWRLGRQPARRVCRREILCCGRLKKCYPVTQPIQNYPQLKVFNISMNLNRERKDPFSSDPRRPLWLLAYR